MHLSKFLHTKSGKYIMSAVLGFGLATMFRAVCKGKNCIVQHAPPLDEIDGKTYKFDGKCYTYSKSSQKCDAQKRPIGV
jgi:hypothetical protein